VFWSFSTYPGIAAFSCLAASRIDGTSAIAKNRTAPPIKRNARVVAIPRPMPRRWKIRTRGSIEKARNPAATSHVIVSRTSQSAIRSAIVRRITTTTVVLLPAKKPRFGRPSGTVRCGARAIIAE
jgi:hypothetical protein